MQLELWQIIVGGIVSIAIGGAGGGGLFWWLVETQRVEATAEDAAIKQTLKSWQALANEQQQRIRDLHEDITRQGRRIEAQEKVIESLQKLLTSTRAELADTQRSLEAAQAQIIHLEAENERLENKLVYERRRRRELEKRFGEANGD